MQSIPGYSGFRRERDKEPVCEKPGDSAGVRNSKFARAGNSIVNPNPMPAVATTTTTAALGTVRPHHYRVPDKRGVMADRESRLPRPVKFLGRSVASSTFVDYKARARRLEAMPEAVLRAKFAELDMDGSGYIEQTEVRGMVLDLFGIEPSDQEMQLMLHFFGGEDYDARISADEFVGSVYKLAKLLKAQSKTGGKRHLKAPWETKHAPRVIGPGEVKSSQEVDVGEDGENPRGRPLMEGVGMRGTTTDLFAGTSKRTLQLPGYGGYIPQAHRLVSDAEAQAIGDHLRNTFHSKTNLLLTVNPAPPGYTGHRSRAPEHMSLGRRSDPRRTTEKAATDKIVLDYWKARNAAAKAAASS